MSKADDRVRELAKERDELAAMVAGAHVVLAGFVDAWDILMGDGSAWPTEAKDALRSFFGHDITLARGMLESVAGSGLRDWAGTPIPRRRSGPSGSCRGSPRCWAPTWSSTSNGRASTRSPAAGCSTSQPATRSPDATTRDRSPEAADVRRNSPSGFDLVFPGPETTHRGKNAATTDGAPPRCRTSPRVAAKNGSRSKPFTWRNGTTSPSPDRRSPASSRMSSAFHGASTRTASPPPSTVILASPWRTIGIGYNFCSSSQQCTNCHSYLIKTFHEFRQ